MNETIRKFLDTHGIKVNTAYKIGGFLYPYYFDEKGVLRWDKDNTEVEENHPIWKTLFDGTATFQECIKISHKNRKLLRALRNLGFLYVAEDEDGSQYASKKKPFLCGGCWIWGYVNESLNLEEQGIYFPFISWGDKESFYISEDL